MSGISVKLPLNISPDDGAYQLVKNYKTLINQNFKNLVLTNPGERIMDINFGVGIRRLFFENNSPLLHDDIRSKINEQAAKYMPFIQINDIQISGPEILDLADEHFLKVKIFYTILPLGVDDILGLTEKDVKN